MNSKSQSAPSSPGMPGGERSDRTRGEYIVKLKIGVQGGDVSIRNAYSDFGVLRLTLIGDRQYLLKLEEDPGLAAIKQKADSTSVIESVQPNFSYRTQ